ncbi:unnamed protein product [Rotaria sp. Silwood2]|nr:unnamed protein product [Rotaria sp. Silwood2]
MNQDLFDPLFDVIVQENDESNENEIHQDDIYYDINNVVVNNEYEDVQDDYDFENCQIDHVINDESIDVEMNMNVKVATFICSSQLDKSNANQLIKLLNHVHDQETPPPLSLVSLWNQLKVKFNYTTKKYCSHCMLELIKCTCNNTNRVLNSELIVFSITEEITRVVKNNYDLIMKYRLEKQKNKDDIVQEWNELHSGTSAQTCQIINAFDDFLSNINYPHSIHRRVKCFRKFNDWKASELRLFLLYLALPFLLYFSSYFSPLLVYHFSLYAIYVRTLCKFDERQHVYDVRPFIETHLQRFSEFYKSKELLSTHCNVHLWQQVIRHGSLSSTRYD